MFARRRTLKNKFLFYSLLGGVAGVAGVLWLKNGQFENNRQRFGKLKELIQKPILTQTLLEVGKEWSEEIEEIVHSTKSSETSQHPKKEEEPEIGVLIQKVLNEEPSH